MNSNLLDKEIRLRQSVLIAGITFLILSFTSVNLNAQANRTNLGNRIHKVVERVAYFDSSKCSDLKAKQKLKCAEEAMFEFVCANIEYPEEAKINQIEGRVVIRFIVEKDGSLTGFQIVKDLENGCGQEVLNAARKIEKFVPARINGGAVRTYFNLALKFYLDRENDNFVITKN